MADTQRTEIRIAGSGGQGLILGARILFKALALSGRQAAQSQSYEPTSRGGFCHSDLVVSDGEPDYPLVTGIDYLIVLDQVGADRSVDVVGSDALVVADARLVPNPPAASNLKSLPLTDRAIALGSHRVANIVALGVLVGLTGICPRDILEQAVRSETPKKFADLNVAALQEGFRLAEEQAAA
ncbi:MAG: 2-oxoacid:acceptor oxidoreductase family protein [Hyphomicrobiales bacterium]